MRLNAGPRYENFFRSILGDEFYYHIPRDFLPDLGETLEGIFRGISSNDSIKETAGIFHVQLEQVTPEMRRLAKEIRTLRNSRLKV